MKESDPLVGGRHDESTKGEARGFQAVTHLKPFAGANAATPANKVLVHKGGNGFGTESPVAKRRRIGVIGGMQVNEEKLEGIPRALERVHEALPDEIGPGRAVVPLEGRDEIHGLGSGGGDGNQGGRGGGRGRGRAQAHQAQRVGKNSPGGPQAQTDRS